jgi:hypothetical protein
MGEQGRESLLDEIARKLEESRIRHRRSDLRLHCEIGELLISLCGGSEQAHRRGPKPQAATLSRAKLPLPADEASRLIGTARLFASAPVLWQYASRLTPGHIAATARLLPPDRTSVLKCAARRGWSVQTTRAAVRRRAAKH